MSIEVCEKINIILAASGLGFRYKVRMRKELMMAASLILTHAYARGAEQLCESEWGFSEDSKKFIRREVEGHCNYIMALTEPKAQSKKKLRVQRRAPAEATL